MDMEHKEITREKENLIICSPYYERKFWKAIEVSNEPRLNIDEQHHDKTFEGLSDIDDLD